MAAFLENAKKHYQAKLGRTPRRLEVPEFAKPGEKKPAVVYIRPGMNLERTGEILELSNSGKSAEAMVMTIIYRLVDKEGDPIFRKADRMDLMRHIDPGVIAELVSEINREDPDLEDARKN